MRLCVPLLSQPSTDHFSSVPGEVLCHAYAAITFNGLCPAARFGSFLAFTTLSTLIQVTFDRVVPRKTLAAAWTRWAETHMHAQDVSNPTGNVGQGLRTSWDGTDHLGDFWLQRPVVGMRRSDTLR